MDKRILGLDTGTNSLGWAVVDRHDDDTYTLIKKGSVVFPEGVKREQGREQSRAAERTEKRGQRRLYYRRRYRKIRVLRILVKYHLCPPLTEEELNEWHIHKVYPQNEMFRKWQRTSDRKINETDNTKIDRNPYIDRHKCLHDTLDLTKLDNRYTLGRAIYHLAQRRGFLSMNTDSNVEDDPDGAVATGISNLEEEIRNNGFEFLGDYFYHLYKTQCNRVRIRCRYIDREKQYKKEFLEICRVQHLDNAFVEELSDAIYSPGKKGKQNKGVGKCTFEPKCHRCAISHPDFEEYNMLQFVNNIKVKGPVDISPRQLNEKERTKIHKLFFQKTKPDFEKIAKKIAGAGNYSCKYDTEERPYKFNFPKTYDVPTCPTIALLIPIFGQDWRDGIIESYTANKDGKKTPDDIVNEVWNVLKSFNSSEKKELWGKKFLQLNEENAKKFADIKLSGTQYASLSLKAIHKILPFLRQGMKYSHAVFMANIPTIVGKDVWEDENSRDFIYKNVRSIIEDRDRTQVTYECIKDFLLDNFDLQPRAADTLYHPSMINVYPDASKNKDGIYQLGSPETDAIRNPMAMRSLHVIRKVVNELLKEKIVDQTAEVHVEYSRDLNNANMRMAISAYQNAQKKKREKYAEEIKELYKKETKKDYKEIITDKEITKFQLWEEQGRHSIYTGNPIGIADFLNDDQRYDFEHTIPQSRGGDSTLENLTLCESRFNREVKRDMLPSELSNHDDILVRIEPWKERAEELTRSINRIKLQPNMLKTEKDELIQRRHRLELEKDYWWGKYKRFIMTEVPEGFSRRQGVDIGVISKYAGLYLKSLFHDNDNKRKNQVFIVKGVTTMEFRKMWGLQPKDEAKSRDNHCHHCIDAITIACIGKAEYDRMAQYYHDLERYDWGEGVKPHFPKPWATFTEDVLSISKDTLIVHKSSDSMPKKRKWKVQTAKGEKEVKFNSARAKLHEETFYGAIKRDGEIKYVVRKDLSKLEEKQLKNIVDDTVRQKVLEFVMANGFKSLKDPEKKVYMNEDKGIVIKKVRCFTNIKNPLHFNKKQRDLSKKEYKRDFYVVNDTNYLMAIYEGEVNGKTKREVEYVNTLDAAIFYRASNDRTIYSSIVPVKSIKYGLLLKYKLYIGTMVLLYENDPTEIDWNNSQELTKRLYKVCGLDASNRRIMLIHNQEARMAQDIKPHIGAYQYKEDEDVYPKIRMGYMQFHALVEGKDFKINSLGEIKKTC